MFNIKKYLKNTVVLLAMFIPTVFAAAQQDVHQGVDVSVRDSQILSQSGNDISLTFTIRNNNQTDYYLVNHAVSLHVAEDGIPGQVVHSVPLGEIQISAGGSEKINYVYSLPNNLSGDFIIQPRVMDLAEIVVARGQLPTITLLADAKGLFVDERNCQLSVLGEDGGFNLYEGVDVAEDEVLNFSCTANFLPNTEYDLYTETRERNRYGEVVGPLKKIETIASDGNGDISFSVDIDRPSNPQSYSTSFTFVNGENKSNDVSARYVVRGSSASIHSINLDRYEYQKGEVAAVEVNASPNAQNFPGARDEENDQYQSAGEVVNISISDIKGNTCGTGQASLSDVLTTGLVSVNIDKNCSGAYVDGEILSANGQTLASAKTGAIKDKEEVERQENKTQPLFSLSLGNGSYYILGGLVFLIAFIWSAIKKNRTWATITLLLVIVSLLLFALKAEAAYRTIINNGGATNGSEVTLNEWGSGNNLGYAVTLGMYYDSTEDDYSCTENVIANMSVSHGSCGNAVTDVEMFMNIDGGPWQSVGRRYDNSTGDHEADVRDVSEATMNFGVLPAGTHEIGFRVVYGRLYYTPRRVVTEVIREEYRTITVTGCDTNATCGLAAGRNHQTEPTTGLCGLGDGLQGSVTQNPDGSKSWSWTCAGSGSGSNAVCSTNTCNANYGNSCESPANACGVTNSGVYNCSGQCVNSLAANNVLSAPNVAVTNPTYNQTRTSSANACGARTTTRGTCDAPAPAPTAPSTASCPVGPVCITDNDPDTAVPASLSSPSDGVVRPTAIDEEGNTISLGEDFRLEGNPSTYKVGSKCLVYNPECPGQAPNESYVTCDGTCAVGQPVCGGVQCTSRGNVNGKTNTIYVENAEQCNVIVPSDSVCEIPSFGFRTKNGLYTVDPGTEKTLVWDTVLNATRCTITGPDNETLAVLNNFIRDTSRPQPGHSWTNILPSGEIETGPINQTSEYEMTCINVDSPEVTERLRITLTPNIIED